MKVTTKLTKENLQTAFAVLFSINHKKINLFSLIVIIAIAIYGVVIRKNIVINILILIVLYFLYYSLFRLWHVKKRLKEAQSMWNKEVVYDFQDKQVHLKSSTTDEIYRYVAFKQIINYRNYWYLIDNDHCLWIVEKPTDKKLMNDIDHLLKDNQIKYITKKNKFI